MVARSRSPRRRKASRGQRKKAGRKTARKSAKKKAKKAKKAKPKTAKPSTKRANRSSPKKAATKIAKRSAKRTTAATKTAKRSAKRTAADRRSKAGRRPKKAPTKRELTRLGSAERRAGSVAALAKALGVSASTVHRWRKVGISEAGFEKIEAFIQSEKLERSRQAADQQIFEELMRKAQTEGVLSDEDREMFVRMLNVRTYKRRHVGSNSYGLEWVKRFSQTLTLDLINRVDVWMTSLWGQRSFPFWNAVATISHYSKSGAHGYRSVFRQFDPQSGNFFIRDLLTTHRTKRFREMASEILEPLENMLTEGSHVFLHSVKVSNYQLRTPRGRSQYQTKLRKEREKRKRASQ